MNTVPAAGARTGSSNGPFCGHCGEPDDVRLPAWDEHRRCVELLTLEPPRYCAHCRRRMKVQVTPTGWSAECSRHGVLIR